MGARQQLAGALIQGLNDDTVQVVPDLRVLGTLDPQTSWIIQLFRTSIEPGSTIGKFWADFELWVVDPSKESETVEDSLDDHVDDLINVLDSLTWLTWSKAERDTHPSGYHGYRLTIRASATN